MNDMYLSPRRYYCFSEWGFQCCIHCHKQLNTKARPCQIELPCFAIANGAVFGEAPSELTDLNECELALVSRARTNKHVFAFIGGSHKCMQGWHNLYENDIKGIARTVNNIPNMMENSMVMCVLLGPTCLSRNALSKTQWWLDRTWFCVPWVGWKRTMCYIMIYSYRRKTISQRWLLLIEVNMLIQKIPISNHNLSTPLHSRVQLTYQ